MSALDQFKRGTVGNGDDKPTRRGVTGATYSREALRQQQAQAQQRDSQPAQRDSAPAKRDEKPVRRNKYGAKCANCGVFVPEQEGRLENKGGKWVVSHIPPCPEPSEPAPVGLAVEEFDPSERQHNVVNGEIVYDGLYTVETPDGHRTLKLRTQPEDKDFMPGVQIVAYLAGPDNERDYERFGHIKDGRLSVWKRFKGNTALVRDVEALLADPSGALTSASCFKCGRTLTVPASVNAGLGPECAKRR